MEENEMKAQPAVLHMTVQVTRAATGKVEEYQLVGTGLTVEDCQRAGIVRHDEPTPINNPQALAMKFTPATKEPQ